MFSILFEMVNDILLQSGDDVYESNKPEGLFISTQIAVSGGTICYSVFYCNFMDANEICIQWRDEEGVELWHTNITQLTEDTAGWLNAMQ